jgi:ClpP class serine protease
MPGRTLIAMAADEIIMSPHAVLGPTDPQLGQYPATSIIKAVEQKPMERIEDKTLILADVGRKAIAQVRHAAAELLSRRLPPEQTAALSEKLSTGTWTHDFPIFPEKAKELGLLVSTDIPKEVLKLMTLYPQPSRTQTGGVEYLPEPRQKNIARRSS